jgi:chromodomain-helicase-DNA-binding protein 7
MVVTIDHANEGQARHPFLVIVPLSTISHWKREFEAWTDMNVVVFQGTRSDRDLIRHYEWHYWDEDGREMHVGKYFKFNALIATYESVMAETAPLSKINWRFIVVDEAHRMKNKSSKLFKTLKSFKSEHRVLLTGTSKHASLSLLSIMTQHSC